MANIAHVELTHIGALLCILQYQIKNGCPIAVKHKGLLCGRNAMQHTNIIQDHGQHKSNGQLLKEMSVVFL